LKIRFIKKLIPNRTQRILVNFRSLAAWIWRDAIWQFRKPAAGVILIGGAGLICEFAAYGLLYAYAKAVEAERVIPFVDHEFAARSSAIILFGVALAMFSLLILSAFLLYIANTKSAWMRVEYQKLCSRRIFVYASRLPHASVSRANQMFDQKTLRLLSNRDTSYCGNLRQLAGTLPKYCAATRKVSGERDGDYLYQCVILAHSRSYSLSC
jgi:signal transduction histidine kinase